MHTTWNTHKQGAKQLSLTDIDQIAHTKDGNYTKSNTSISSTRRTKMRIYIY